MPQSFLDSITVDGTVQAQNFIGSAEGLTDVAQTATLDGFNPASGGVVAETDTVQQALEKIVYNVAHSGGGTGGGDLFYVHNQAISSLS